MIKAVTMCPRSLLFVPASRPRMVEKAAGLSADLVILDLEDAVRDEDKPAARAGLCAAIDRFDGRPVAVRVNGQGTSHFDADVDAAAAAGATHIVVPKVERPQTIAALARTGLPVLAMIETPAAVLDLRSIAAAPGLAGLIAGTNDLASALRLPAGADRANLSSALQIIVLAARAYGLWVFDGVFNALTDPAGLEAECRAGRALGFDGKTLIHPDQVEIANGAFAPGDAELDEARALIAAAGGGAERFRDRMIEDMHVVAARALLARSR